MKPTSLLLTALLLLASCSSPPVAPAATPTPPPTATATSSPVPTPSAVFGAIPLNSVQAFSIEPVAKAVFDQTLQGYLASGSLQEFRVDRVAVFPSGQGGLIAEIFYSLRTSADPWLEDGGTPGTDGWITGKCARFDLVATDTEHQLKNKRLCS